MASVHNLVFASRHYQPLKTRGSPPGHPPQCIHLVHVIVLRGALDYSWSFRLETAGEYKKAQSVVTLSPHSGYWTVIKLFLILVLTENLQFT